MTSLAIYNTIQQDLWFLRILEMLEVSPIAMVEATARLLEGSWALIWSSGVNRFVLSSRQHVPTNTSSHPHVTLFAG
jgi:hypothetical protein